MSRNLSGVPNNLYNFSDNMDESTAQPYACDSTSTTGSPSQASQTCSHISTSHIEDTQHYGCSLPLANTSSYRLSPPSFNTSWIAPPFGFDFDFASFSLGPHSGMGEGSIISTERDYTEGDFEDNGNPAPYTSFQDHKSGFNANDATSSGGLPSYFSEPLIPESLELGDYHYPISSYPKGDHIPSDHWSNRGRSENPSASPVAISVSSKKGYNDSDRNSNDSKVTKTKIHQCTEYNCGKIFGRSAELKRHKSSVHRAQIPKDKRQELFNCPYEGCERVGEKGFKRKDNRVQHLRGVHGDHIKKKKSTTRKTSPGSSARAGSPVMTTKYEQFSQGQQQEPPAYMNQQPIFQEEGRGSPPVVSEFLGMCWEGAEY